jgi:hypothetical protein
MLGAGCGNVLGGSVRSISYLLHQKCETHKFFSSGVSMIDSDAVQRKMQVAAIPEMWEK